VFLVYSVSFRNVFASTYGIDNQTGNKMNVKFDMETSENLEFSTKTKVASRLVEPQNMEFLLHCQAGIGQSNKAFQEEVEQIIKK
jgi:hypothetical protein